MPVTVPMFFACGHRRATVDAMAWGRALERRAPARNRPGRLAMTQREERRPTRPAAKPSGDTRTPDQLTTQLDRRLDEALQETFPASDPIALTPPRAQGQPRAARRR